MTMHTLYLVSVFFHLLAVIAWIGSMFFLVFVAVPWMRTGDRALAMKFLRESGSRLRNMGWVAFGVVLVTGTFNLYVRGVRFSSFVDPFWLGSPFGKGVVAKLAVFATVIAMSAVHDFYIGPNATEGEPEKVERFRKTASAMGRINFVLALVLVALGVMIVRGFPE